MIGFPNGYSTTQGKVFETEDAIRNGADEIDMVINLGWVKDALWPQILEELRTVKASCQGRILKAGADYIKTSTGFSTGGATLADVALFKEHIGVNVKIKAAGGIRTLEDAQAFLDQGADRLGTSAIVKLVRGKEA